MISVDTVVDNIYWNKRLKKPSFFFNRIVKNFPKKFSFRGKKVKITLLLSINRDIKKLNKRFRNKNKSTDVLSFPFMDKPNKKKNLYLGDIVISYEFMNSPRNLTDLEFQKKVIKIFIHGFLHLLNYDHLKLKDYKKMNKEEINIYNAISKKIKKFV